MENFFHDNAIYIVLAVTTIIWLGISSYLFSLDKRISNLEKISNSED